ITSFSQKDLNGDGRIDMAEIMCSCVTNNDRVLVLDGSGDMATAQDWQVGTDTTNDTWIFDIGAKGRATLIVAFRNEAGKQLAELYDDINGDGQVAYQIIGKSIHIDESNYWTLQVAASGWLTTDGQAALNLSVLYDKPLVTSLSSE